MKLRYTFRVLYTIIIFLSFAHPVLSQDSSQTAKQIKSPPLRLMFRLSDQDVILPISSIEWGIPDRWSFTSRYIHEFDKTKIKRTWKNNISLSISPGISGGRVAIGYQGIYLPKSMREFGIISEARLVLLRTWGNPLFTPPNSTFAGAEIRCSLILINLGIGYYKQISRTNGDRQDFYGYHVGVGI